MKLIPTHGAGASRWKRQGHAWYLVRHGQVLAHIIPDHRRWLCYTAADNGDDGLLGPARSLAAAKAILKRHALASIGYRRAGGAVPL